MISPLIFSNFDDEDIMTYPNFQFDNASNSSEGQGEEVVEKMDQSNDLLSSEQISNLLTTQYQKCAHVNDPQLLSGFHIDFDSDDDLHCARYDACAFDLPSNYEPIDHHDDNADEDKQSLDCSDALYNEYESVYANANYEIYFDEFEAANNNEVCISNEPSLENLNADLDKSLFADLDEPSHKSLNVNMDVDFNEKSNYISELELLIIEQAWDVENVDMSCSKDNKVSKDKLEILDDSQYQHDGEQLQSVLMHECISLNTLGNGLHSDQDHMKA